MDLKRSVSTTFILHVYEKNTFFTVKYRLGYNMLTAGEYQRFSFKVGQHTKHELLLENRIE